MVKFSKTWNWESAEFAWSSATSPHQSANFPVSSLGSEPTVGHWRVTAHASDRYIASFPNVAYGQVLLWSITMDTPSDPRDTGSFDGDVIARGALYPHMSVWVPPHEGQTNWSGAGRDHQRSDSQGMRTADVGGDGVIVNVAPVGPVPSETNPFIWIGVRFLVMLPPVPA